MTPPSTSPLSPGAAQAWFGDAFSRLHPLLQQLHRCGGTLDGVIDIETASGVAGFLGRRLAAKLGVPVTYPQCHFQVRVSHEQSRMVWARRFLLPDGTTRELTSTFTPHGAYPDGFWSETTGSMQLRVGVEITPDGGWQWRPRQVRLFGMPLPPGLFPSSQAGKHIEDGQYRFEVSFAVPGFGRLLRYGGLLTAAFGTPADMQCR